MKTKQDEIISPSTNPTVCRYIVFVLDGKIKEREINYFGTETQNNYHLTYEQDSRELDMDYSTLRPGKLFKKSDMMQVIEGNNIIRVGSPATASFSIWFLPEQKELALAAIKKSIIPFLELKEIEIEKLKSSLEEKKNIFINWIKNVK